MASKDLKDISEIASKLGLSENEYEKYGNHMAKVSLEVLKRVQKNRRGKLILVTAMNPTKEGEGKTTTTIGLEKGEEDRYWKSKGLIHQELIIYQPFLQY